MEGFSVKLLSIEACNFASYDRLSFKFNGSGLVLISGPTGAGKSTLCDLVPWALFGTTAKGGAVDEIRSWNSDKPTQSVIKFELNGKEASIHRVRGTAPQNDLMFFDGTAWHRGKDLNDTQKLLNNILGMTAETYLAGAYFHEFSQTANFFSTTAKSRRATIEQLADLSLPIKISNNTHEYKKELKSELDQIRQALSTNSALKASLADQIKSTSENVVTWYKNQEQKIMTSRTKASSFDTDQKERIENATSDKVHESNQLNDRIIHLSAKWSAIIIDPDYQSQLQNNLEQLKSGSVCTECGSKKHSDKILMIERSLNQLKSQQNERDNINIAISQCYNELRTLESRHNKWLEQESLRTNHYLASIQDLETQINPYEVTLGSLNYKLSESKKEAKASSKEYEDISAELADLDLLLVVTSELRAVLVKNTVVNLKNNINKLLTDYFDAEITVDFTIEDHDKLDVTIHKDGNFCSFTQLSKGQRQLLKLCFGVSVMRAISNFHGISFNTLFFDEVFSGLDTEKALKGYQLINSLTKEYENIFIIDHNDEIKALADRKIEVELVNGVSVLDEQ